MYFCPDRCTGLKALKGAILQNRPYELPLAIEAVSKRWARLRAKELSSMRKRGVGVETKTEPVCGRQRLKAILTPANGLRPDNMIPPT